jgi:hypothetical protein
MSVVHIALDMKVAVYTNGPVIAEFEKATTLVRKPKLAPRRDRWHLLIRKASPNDDALLHIAFLRNEKHLVTGLGWADHSPPISDPL